MVWLMVNTYGVDIFECISIVLTSGLLSVVWAFSAELISTLLTLQPMI